MPSILIVEDHKILAEVLSNTLRRSGQFEVAGVVNTAEAALEQLTKLDVDLVLVDISLPQTTGIELVSLIYSKYPHLPCVMISGHSTSHYVNLSLAAGARGYVVKDDIHDILDGVRCVLEGGTYLSKQVDKAKFNKS